jgi:hypothetical protein
MTQIHQIAILFPLAVSAGAVVCTIFVHALALGVTVNFVRHERRLGRAGAGAWIDLAIVALVILFAFVAHLIGIGLWAALFVICGEFQEFGNAYYHSAVNYTTLGEERKRVLGVLRCPRGPITRQPRKKPEAGHAKTKVHRWKASERRWCSLASHGC